MKTLAQCREELITQISTYQSQGILPGVINFNRGIFRGLIELWAFGLSKLYLYIEELLLQAYAITATDSYLDKHCEQVGLTRFKATKTTGVVTFERTSLDSNVLIPKNTIVQTKVDSNGDTIQFQTIEEIIIAEWQSHASAKIESMIFGSIGNVPPFSIIEIVTPIQGVTEVYNESDWIINEGINDETDDQLRQRYILAWQGLGGCNIAAYEAWVYSIQGVLSCKVITGHPRGQGTIDIIVLGIAGLPSKQLINSINTKIESEKPINDDVLVKGPTPISCNIKAKIIVKEGFDPNDRVLLAKNKIIALFDYSHADSLKIGESLKMDRLIYEIMSAGGIDSIEWDSPNTDIVVPVDGLAILDSIQINV